MNSKKKIFEIFYLHRVLRTNRREVKIHRCLSAVSAICKTGLQLPGKTIRPRVLLCPSIALKVMLRWGLWLKEVAVCGRIRG